MFLTIVSIVVCLSYFILVSFFILGWRRIPTFEPNGDKSINVRVSVVLVCRNEEEHLRHFLSSLAQQSYQNFELILVNDHSTDRTRTIMSNVESVFADMKIVDSIGCGKKNGLKEGIDIASGHLIVTSDADCVPSFLWLESIVCFYNEFHSDLIICPVKLKADDTFFTALQSLEFTTLVAAGAGAAGAGKPILCNGANLAFTKQAWLCSWQNLRFDELSGDDVFLLQSIKKRGGDIHFLKSESAFVITEPSATFSAFIKQRRRWAGKSPSYTDIHLIFTACVVLSISLLPFVLLVCCFTNPELLFLILIVFLFKYLIDLIFIRLVSVFFHLRHVWFYAFVLSLIYPLYIVYVGFSALLFKPQKW